MVWFRVWVLEVWFGFGFDLGFCVMTWFNGMVEFFWKILVNGQMVVLGIVTEPMHGCLRTPLVEGLGRHGVH